jgi:hypothetical protein
MYMPKKPLSVTLEEDNLIWLRGRAATTKRRSLSEALDEVVTAARSGGYGAGPARSVVGTVDISADDPDLLRADTYVNTLLGDSLGQPIMVREAPPELPPAASARGGKPRG